MTSNFIQLKIELKCPPGPDATCRYSECLKINQDNHIIPSKKIYKSDPNFKPFYKIFCNSSCILDYHDSCWNSLKSDMSKMKGSKIPTEKDFCGQKCFTPDCEGIIIKIQIVDAMESMTIENKRLNERLEQEEAVKKEAEKVRKVEEFKKQQQKKLEAKANTNNPRKKERSRSKSVTSDLTEPRETNSDGTKDNNNDKKELNPYENLPDLSKVPMAILKKKDRDNENDDETNDNKKKERKKKEKATLSLGEFNGDMEVKSNDEFANRIEKLAAMKKTHENYNPSAFIHPNLNPNAKTFNPIPVSSVLKTPLLKTTVEESIKTFVYDQLNRFGPMKDSDSRLTKDLSTDAMNTIYDGIGLIKLLKSDERFGSYDNYLCLKGDAEKAKKLKDEEDKKMQNSMSSKTPMNESLGDTARKLKEQLEKKKTSLESNKAKEIKGKGFGLQEVSEEPSLLESIKKQMEAGAMRPSLGAGPCYRTEGVQTDVSSIELDTDDPFMLQQNNELLAGELQTVNDKLVILQNKSKLEQRDLSTQIANLESEKLVLELKVQDLEEKIKSREQAFKEAIKTQKDLKVAKENFEASHKKTVSLEREMKDLKKKLETEQKLSFTLGQKVSKLPEKEDTIKTLKLKCLKSDYDRKKDILNQKKGDNEMLIDHLRRMSNSEHNTASSAAIRDAIDKLNAYSAILFSGLDMLRMRYEERKGGIEKAPASNHHTEINFEVNSVKAPNLDSLHLNNIKLLTTVMPYQVKLIIFIYL